MRRKVKVWAGLLCALAVLGLFSTLMLQPEAGTMDGTPMARQANVSSLKAAYLDWTADHVAQGGDRNVILALGWSKGVSREYTEASGVARLDLIGGFAEVELAGLKPGERWDVWLVENQPGGSALPEPNDKAQRLGRVVADQGKGRLAVRLEPGFFQRFQADMMVVSRAGTRPEAGVLFGSPDLFQRLYTQGRTRPSMMAGHTPAAALFGPRLAFATPFDSLEPLVAQGADLFFNETFNGNGRTCGTCHPARNNFTIDPKFIATLPPDDPLFVAEFNPDLAQNFEKPQLMRELGLVLENVDGFDNLSTKFVLRGVQHTLGLMNSRRRQPGTPFPVERLGWGGDGAVTGGGTLRDFALGAINQHLTRKLTRTPGVDFRLPTDQELDAMAAFQLALGRPADLDLQAIQFRSPVVTRGREIYFASSSAGGTIAAGKCNLCHGNGGALGIEGDNRNFDVGVEKLPDHPANLIAPGVMPRDGGFLRVANPDGSFGVNRFNTPTVVEAADTGPFFHNNAVDTIEEAVAFYNSKAFNDSEVGRNFKIADGGVGIQLETTHVEAIAAMLRVLNALENIRSSAELDQAAYDQKDFAKAGTLLDIASFDTEDAFQVLNERNLHPIAAQNLKLAYEKEREASREHSRPRRDDLIQEILQLKEAAREDMIVP